MDLTDEQVAQAADWALKATPGELGWRDLELATRIIYAPDAQPLPRPGGLSFSGAEIDRVRAVAAEVIANILAYCEDAGAGPGLVCNQVNETLAANDVTRYELLHAPTGRVVVGDVVHVLERPEGNGLVLDVFAEGTDARAAAALFGIERPEIHKEELLGTGYIDELRSHIAAEVAGDADGHGAPGTRWCAPGSHWVDAGDIVRDRPQLGPICDAHDDPRLDSYEEVEGDEYNGGEP